MTLGPIDVVALGFEGDHFKREIIPAVADLVEKKIIRIIELAFVTKTADGMVSSLEPGQIDDELARKLHLNVDNVSGLLSEDDIREFGAGMANNSSVGLLVVEHVWLAQLRQAIIAADGKLLLHVRIPQEVIDQAELAGVPNPPS